MQWMHDGGMSGVDCPVSRGCVAARWLASLFFDPSILSYHPTYRSGSSKILQKNANFPLVHVGALESYLNYT